jgi:hypothetical protein
MKSLCRVPIMSARSRRMYPAYSGIAIVRVGRTKALKWSSGESTRLEYVDGYGIHFRWTLNSRSRIGATM